MYTFPNQTLAVRIPKVNENESGKFKHLAIGIYYREAREDERSFIEYIATRHTARDHRVNHEAAAAISGLINRLHNFANDFQTHKSPRWSEANIRDGDCRPHLSLSLGCCLFGFRNSFAWDKIFHYMRVLTLLPSYSCMSIKSLSLAKRVCLLCVHIQHDKSLGDIYTLKRGRGLFCLSNRRLFSQLTVSVNAREQDERFGCMGVKEFLHIYIHGKCSEELFLFSYLFGFHFSVFMSELRSVYLVHLIFIYSLKKKKILYWIFYSN